MDISKKSLEAKGWSQEEIHQTTHILAKHRRKKNTRTGRLNEAIYWAVLLLGAFSMIGVAIWVIPVFVFANAAVLYPLLIFIALGFGILFSHLVKDLDHLTLRHHMMLSSSIPVIGIISFLIVVGQTNTFVALGGHHHNALLVGVIFTTCFITPYIHNLSRK